MKDAEIEVDESAVNKVKLEMPLEDGNTLTRYAFRAIDDDGTPMTLVVTKDVWDKL